MKKILIFSLTLFLFSCTSYRSKDKETIKIKPTPISSKIFLSWENLNNDEYFIIKFTEDKCEISVPQYNIKKDFDIIYEKKRIIIKIDLGEYLSKNVSRVKAVQNFYIYDLLNNISLKKVYINKASHIGEFIYEFNIENNYLYINPNSSKLIALKKY